MRPSPLVSALGRPRLAVRGPPGGRCSARGAEKRAATLLRRGRDQENRGTRIFNIYCNHNIIFIIMVISTIQYQYIEYHYHYEYYSICSIMGNS